MMKKKLFLLIVIVTAIVDFSCKKNEAPVQNTNNLPPAGSRVKTRSVNGSITSYEYDASGRATKWVSNNKLYYDFVYNADSLLETEYKSDGSIKGAHHIKLNASGYVENYLNTEFPFIFIKYEYNANGTKAMQYNYDHGNLNSVTRFFYNNGNLVKDSAYSPSGSGWNGRLYEYYTDKYTSTENENIGVRYWGTGNKNALKKITYLNTGVISGTQDFQVPQSDALNRTTQTSYLTNGAGTPVVVIYTYY